MNKKIKKTAILFMFMLIAFLPYLIFLKAIPIGRDSGVYMYGGMVLYNGGVPYVSAWDHKGPLLYLFNAVGFYLLNGPRGVILLEAVMFMTSLLLSMWLWRKVVSYNSMMLAALLYVAYYYVTFEGGNLTETWCVPFLLIVYSLGLVYYSRREKNIGLTIILGVIIGISISVGLLIRPNNSVGVAVFALYFIFSSKQQMFERAVFVLLAAFAVALPLLAIIFESGAIYDFYDQYLAYNSRYVGSTPLTSRIYSVVYLAQNVLYSGIGLALLAGILLAQGCDEKLQATNYFSKYFNLMVVVASFEVLSQVVSGKSFLHYSSLLAPVLVVLLVTNFARLSSCSLYHLLYKKRSLRALFFIVLVVIFFQPIKPIVTSLKAGIESPGSLAYELRNYISAHTDVTDRVLVHGAETWLLVAAGRFSPTSITYYYPALQGYGTSYKKYVDEAIAGKPKYIVETPDSCGLTLRSCNSSMYGFVEIKRFLDDQYVLDQEISGYRMWRRKDS